MGTITFPTTETAGKVLQAELCGPDAKIRMFTTDHESAAVALSIDLAKLDDAERRRFDQVYDLPANAKRAIVCVVAKQSGLNGRSCPRHPQWSPQVHAAVLSCHCQTGQATQWSHRF